MNLRRMCILLVLGVGVDRVVLFKSSVSSVICLDLPSISKRGVSKFPAIIVFLYISQCLLSIFRCSNDGCIYIYICNCLIFLVN